MIFLDIRDPGYKGPGMGALRGWCDIHHCGCEVRPHNGSWILVCPMCEDDKYDDPVYGTSVYDGMAEVKESDV